jgi:membrane protein DedA with SNARE-associated domain
MLFWGAQNLSWGRFLSIDVPACAAWSLLLAAFGYSFSNATAVLLGDVKRIELLLLAAAVLSGALLASTRILGRRSDAG